MLQEITIKTPQHELIIECYFGFIDITKVEVKKELFLDMCKSGCKNYDFKYSCPPFSPTFDFCINQNKELFVLLFKINLSQLDEYKEYHKLRVGNAVLKPRIEKIMQTLENSLGKKYFGTGACRLCKPCQRKLKKPCRYPEKKHYSLESLGVNCNKLTLDLFHFPLEWYKDKKAPKYTCVISGLPLMNKEEKETILKLLHVRNMPLVF